MKSDAARSGAADPTGEPKEAPPPPGEPQSPSRPSPWSVARSWCVRALEWFTGALGGALPALVVSIAYVTFVATQHDYSRVFEFDPDEGNNLIKTILLANGNEFFTDIWSDQPPFLAYVLWGAFRLFGWDVNVGREVILAFAGMGIFATYDTLRIAAGPRSGHQAGLAGSLLLVLSNLFVQLSVSVMIGLPSITLMMLGVWALTRFRAARTERKPMWLAVSGVAMALSVATKVFTGFLVPIYGLLILFWALAEGGREVPRRILRAGVVFGGGFIVAFTIAFWPVLSSMSVGALVSAHETARASRSGSADGLDTVLAFIRDDAPLFALAVLGIFRALVRRNVDVMLWGLWLCLAVLMLYDHYPVWPHHRLLLTAPAAVCGGYAVGELLAWPAVLAEGRWARMLGFAAPCAVAALLVFSNPQLEKSLTRGKPWSSTSRDRKVQEAIEPYRDRIRYMVTARQIYAFRAGVPVPPNLGVTSYKRFKTGLLKTSDIVSDVRKYRPELVVLSSRWSGGTRRAVQREMNGKYERVYRDKKHQSVEVYVRRDVAESRH